MYLHQLAFDLKNPLDKGRKNAIYWSGIKINVGCQRRCGNLGDKSRLKGMCLYDRIFVFFLLFIVIPKVWLSRFNSPLGSYGDEFDYIKFGLYMAGMNIPSYSSLLMRPPLLPFIISIFVRLNLVDAINLIGPFFSVLEIISVYLICDVMADKRVGLLSCMLVGVNWHLWWYSNQTLTDAPVAALISLCFYFFIRYVKTGKPSYLYVCGAFSSLTFLMKYMGILVVLPIIGYLSWRGRTKLINREFVIAVLIALCFVLPWLTFNYSHYGGDILGPLREQWAVNKPFIQESDPSIGAAARSNDFLWWLYSTFYYVVYMPFAISFLCFLFSCLGFVSLFRSRGQYKPLLLALFLTFFICYSFLIKVRTEQYLTHFSFVLLIFSALGWETLRTRSLKIAYERFGGMNVKWMFGILAVLMLLSTSNANPLFVFDLQTNFPYLGVRTPYFVYERIIVHYQKTALYKEEYLAETLEYIKDDTPRSSLILTTCIPKDWIMCISFRQAISYNLSNPSLPYEAQQAMHTYILTTHSELVEYNLSAKAVLEYENGKYVLLRLL